MMDMMVDFNGWALIISIGAAILSIPLFLLLRINHRTPPLLGFIVLMLAFGGAVGAWGRLIAAEDPTLDYWVRIFVIATRTAVVGAMLYDLSWLWDRRYK